VSFTGKYEFISFHDAYHGRTLGTRGLDLWWGKGFGPVGSNGIRSPFAYCYRCPLGLEHPACELRCAEYLKEAIKYNSTGSIAAIVFEPILGAGGVVIPPDGFLQRIVEIARENGAMIIADKILTGMGHTGRFLAVEHWDIQPDMVLTGKGLGSGFPVMVLASMHEVMTQLPFGAPGGHRSASGQPACCSYRFGYIPTRAAYDRGGYQIGVGTRLAPGVGEEILTKVLCKLNSSVLLA